MSWLDWLQGYDDRFFVLINQNWTTPWLSDFFSQITNLHNVTWFKFYFVPLLILVLFLFFKHNAIKFVMVMGLTAGASDSLGYRALKPFFERQRPLYQEHLHAEVRLPHRPESGSFPSNHAVTTTALAVVGSWFFPPISAFLYLFALLVSYSRVYVGVHYPSDVIGGMLIGLFLGKFLVAFMFSRISWLYPE